MIRLVRIFSVFLFAFCFLKLSAQQPVTNIDQLSDQQLIQYMNQANLSGLSDAELEAKAKAKGLSNEQIQKLKQRMQTLNGQLGTGNNNGNSGQTDMYSERTKVDTKRPFRRDSLPEGSLRVFGEDLFANENLTFEPNLNIATPRNYMIGVNDQLIIDIFGNSENTRKLKVNAEGAIRFPNLGPVRVAGMTIEDATKKIRQALIRIYPGIAAGNTSVQVSIGQIRSIRVTLLGEIKRAGTYTLPSLATIANALYASGGPNAIGSLRDIELMRNGKTVVTFDFYDFLLRGNLTKNLLLQDDDIVKVNPYTKRVSVKGAVKKPAIFEVKEGEHLSDLIKYSGGFADIAYKELIRVTRFGKENREMITVKASQFQQFPLVSGDTLTADSLAVLFSNRVMISGAVYYPGSYGITELPTLKDLITTVKPREDAYKQRAMLRRLQTDYTPAIINFNVDEVMAGKFNIDLQREDSVFIFSTDSVREKYMLVINGEVNKPGSYHYADNMKVQDLILLSSGFKDGASQKTIEVSRRIRQTNNERDTSVYAIIKLIDLQDQASTNDSSLSFSLKPFDMVSVRRSPSYKEQITVSIEGQVLYPGTYTVSGNKERLSDLVKRAGGLKVEAYAGGALLVRNTFQGTTDTDTTLYNNKLNALTVQNEDALTVRNTDKSMLDTAKLTSLTNSVTVLKKQVGIRLDEVLKDEHSIYNLLLQEGDILKLPQMQQTVQSFGAVYVSQKVVYRKGIRFADVIDQSGGFLNTASPKRSYVMYPNGEVKSTKRFLFFKKYPVIKPGAEVYVPVRRKTSLSEVVSTGAALASVTGLIISLIYLFKK
jgi:protein involved in polysaccharide export with SLBB domain